MMGRKRLTNEIVDQRIAGRPLERGSEYVGSLLRMLWWCLAPGCGHEWKASFSNIKNGSGCPACGNKRKTGRKRHTTEYVAQFLADLQIGGLSEYTGADKPMLLRHLAPGCGHEWWARFSNIKNGIGCPACGNKKIGDKLRYTTEYVDKILAAHRVERRGKYKGNDTPLPVYGLDCGHEWWARFRHIKNGSGCPACATYGFDPSKPGTLYYVKFHGLYKIGITNHTLRKRFGVDNYDRMLILSERRFDIGADAYREEQAILKEHAADRYTGPALLANGGDTELFTRDVLGLDVEAAA